MNIYIYIYIAKKKQQQQQEKTFYEIKSRCNRVKKLPKIEQKKNKYRICGCA